MVDPFIVNIKEHN